MLIDCLVVGDIDIFWERQVVGLIVLSVEGCCVCDDGGGKRRKGRTPAGYLYSTSRQPGSGEGRGDCIPVIVQALNSIGKARHGVRGPCSKG